MQVVLKKIINDPRFERTMVGDIILFIAVAINNLEAAKTERKIRVRLLAPEAIALEIQAVREALTRLVARVDADGSQG